jgi:hypothetical protein
MNSGCRWRALHCEYLAIGSVETDVRTGCLPAVCGGVAGSGRSAMYRLLVGVTHSLP